MFRLADHWVWDSWLADDGELYHLFFLQAPRALGDSRLRHTSATIGHATSPDLVDWTYLGPALEPVRTGWDDLAVWTGSVARGDDGRWRMFYTAIGTHGHGTRDQRIGVAESDDLMNWIRVLDRPAVEVDPRWYQTLPDDPTASETWRDPFVYADPAGGWHMLITARAVDARPRADAVLAHARSTDLLHWQVGPPLTKPGNGFGQLEVSQVHVVDGTPLLMFTCHPQEQSDERLTQYGRFSTWSVVGESVNGPWDVAAARPFLAEPALFAAPLAHRRDGSWALIGFRNLEAEGMDGFEITDPIPVHIRDGALHRIDHDTKPEDPFPARPLEKS